MANPSPRSGSSGTRRQQFTFEESEDEASPSPTESKRELQSALRHIAGCLRRLIEQPNCCDVDEAVRQVRCR